jgi:hypothetical protein
MAADRCCPSARADGSLKSPEPTGADVEAGVGVSGTLLDGPVDPWAGAAGTAGVDATAGTGVEGGFDEGVAALELKAGTGAGAGFGW